MDGAQDEPQQAEVVPGGNPAHQDVAGTNAQHVAGGAQGGQEVAGRDHRGPCLAGGSGRRLQEGDLVGSDLAPGWRRRPRHLLEPGTAQSGLAQRLAQRFGFAGDEGETGLDPSGAADVAVRRSSGSEGAGHGGEPLRAKKARMKSSPAGRKRATRSPGPTPSRARPPASASHSACNRP